MAVTAPIFRLLLRSVHAFCSVREISISSLDTVALHIFLFFHLGPADEQSSRASKPAFTYVHSSPCWPGATDTRLANQEAYNAEYKCTTPGHLSGRRGGPALVSHAGRSGWLSQAVHLE